MAYTKLHDAATQDTKLAEIADTDTLLYVLWMQLLAGAPPWGRYPDDPRLIRVRCCALFDCLPASRVGELVETLVQRGMLQRYVCRWTGTPIVAIAHYSKWNDSGRQYNRLGKPEFAPPEDWTPPSDLVSYLASIASGRFPSKTLAAEAGKFGVPESTVAEIARQAAEDALRPVLDKSKTAAQRGSKSKSKSPLRPVLDKPAAPALRPVLDDSKTTPQPDSQGVRVLDKSKINPDGDGDGDNVSRLTSPGPDGQRSGLEPALASGPVRITRPAADKLWADLNGGEPRKDGDRDRYIDAKVNWMQGGDTELHGYSHPPQVLVDGVAPIMAQRAAL